MVDVNQIPVVPEQGNWFTSIKDGFTNFLSKLHISQQQVFEALLYGGAGFVSGFLFKKYSTYVLVLILLIVSLVALQQFNVLTITIHWDKVQELFGIQPAMVQEGGFLTLLWEWIKANKVISISYVIGFLFGFRFG